MYGKEVGGGVAADEITGLLYPPDRVPDVAISARINDVLHAPALLFGFLIDPEAREEFGRVQHGLRTLHLGSFGCVSVHFRSADIVLATGDNSESGHLIV